MTPSPVASFVIPTRNRRDVLRLALRSFLAQSVPVEILVLSDGSTDGTPDVLRSEFAAVEGLHTDALVRFAHFPEGGLGPCVLRNLGTAAARAPIVFPLDDDSVLTDPHTVARVLPLFDHPRVGAVALPVTTPAGSHALYRPADLPPDGDFLVASEYLGAAHALRRDTFLGLGGYVEEGFYTLEEQELSQRLLDRGLVVRVADCPPVHHHESPLRDARRQHATHAQNSIYFAWRFVPSAVLPLHLVGTAYANLRRGFRVGTPAAHALGLLQGSGLALGHLSQRCPVSLATYRLYRRLRRRQMTAFSVIEPELAPLRPPTLPTLPPGATPEEVGRILTGRRHRWRDA